MQSTIKEFVTFFKTKVPTALKRVSFYVRSYKFTVGELLVILAIYEEDYSDQSFVQPWREKLIPPGEPPLDEGLPVWVRYVGCTTRSASIRAEEDSHAHDANRLANFIKAMKSALGFACF